MELPTDLDAIHIGKPDDRIPSDIDVSGFPNSEIAPRVRADLRVEGDIYYLEELGSCNGIHITSHPLPPGDLSALG